MNISRTTKVGLNGCEEITELMDKYFRAGYGEVEICREAFFGVMDCDCPLLKMDLREIYFEGGYWKVETVTGDGIFKRERDITGHGCGDKGKWWRLRI